MFKKFKGLLFLLTFSSFLMIPKQNIFLFADDEGTPNPSDPSIYTTSQIPSAESASGDGGNNGNGGDLTTTTTDSQNASQQGNQNGQNNSQQEGSTPESNTPIAVTINSGEEDQTPPEQENCTTSQSEFNETHREFNKACKDAKITSLGGSANCFKNIAKCEECQYMSLDEEIPDTESGEMMSRFSMECDTPDEDFELDSFSAFEELANPNQNIVQSALGNQPQNPAQAQAEQRRRLTQINNRFSNCPAASAQGLEKKKEELKELKEKIQNLTEELNKKMQDFSTTKNELEQGKARINEEASKIEQELEDTIDQISQEKDEFKDEITIEIENLNKTILESHQQDRELLLEESIAYSKYRETVSTLKSECHNLALESVNRRRQAILSANAQGKNVRISTRSLFNRAGMSSEQKDEKLIRKTSRKCEKDRNIRRKRKIARDQLDIQKATLAEKRKQNEENRTLLTEKITSLEEKLQRAKRKAHEAISKKIKRARRILEQKNQELKQLIQSQEELLTLKEQDIIQTNQRLKELNDEMQTQKAYLTIVEKYNPNSIYAEEEHLPNAVLKMNEAKTKAFAGINSCKCCSNSPVNAGACTNFSNFLQSYFNISTGTTGNGRVAACSSDILEVTSNINVEEDDTASDEVANEG